MSRSLHHLLAGLLVVSPIAWFACSAPKGAMPESAAPVGASRAAMDGAEEQAGADVSPAAAMARKLVKNANLVLVVDQPGVAAERLGALAESLGGYVSSLSLVDTGESPWVDLTLRVPVDRLDQALEQIKAEARKVERESLNTEDVTGTWIDLDARLRNLTATEDELRQLLSESRERQQKAEDIMAIYRELTGIRGQIEEIRGHLASLDQLASLSTVQVALRADVSAEPIVGDAWRPLETVRGSVRTLLGVLRFLGDVLIALVIVVVPVVVLVGWPLRALFRAWRRWRRAAPSE